LNNNPTDTVVVASIHPLYQCYPLPINAATVIGCKSILPTHHIKCKPELLWLPDCSPETHPIHHILALNSGNGLSDMAISILSSIPLSALAAFARTCYYYYLLITPCMRGGIPEIHAKNTERFKKRWIFDSDIDISIDLPLFGINGFVIRKVMGSFPFFKTMFGPYTTPEGIPCWKIYNQDMLDTWIVRIFFIFPIDLLYIVW
jgi:hypothetical protein